MVQISNSGSKFELKRRAILHAAADAFRQHGFQAAGMRDIAARAGLSPGNLYYYFKSKDELLFFCQDMALDRMLSAARAARKSDEPAPAQLRAVIEAQLTCMLDEVGGGAAHVEVDALPADLRDRIVRKRDRYERLVRGIVDAGVAAGSLRAPAGGSTLAVRAMLGALNWTARWYRPEGRLTSQRVAEGFVDYLVGGLLP